MLACESCSIYCMNVGGHVVEFIRDVLCRGIRLVSWHVSVRVIGRAGVDVRGPGAYSDVLACRTRVPQGVPLQLARRCGAHSQPQHHAHC